MPFRRALIRLCIPKWHVIVWRWKNKQFFAVRFRCWTWTEGLRYMSNSLPSFPESAQTWNDKRLNIPPWYFFLFVCLHVWLYRESANASTLTSTTRLVPAKSRRLPALVSRWTHSWWVRRWLPGKKKKWRTQFFHFLHGKLFSYGLFV